MKVLGIVRINFNIAAFGLKGSGCTSLSDNTDQVSLKPVGINRLFRLFCHV